jgi:hypothetical protein
MTSLSGSTATWPLSPSNPYALVLCPWRASGSTVEGTRSGAGVAKKISVRAITWPNRVPGSVVRLPVFRLHVRDEEALILPEVRRRLSPSNREQLGRSLIERTKQLTGRPRRGW